MVQVKCMTGPQVCRDGGHAFLEQKADSTYAIKYNLDDAGSAKALSLLDVSKFVTICSLFRRDLLYLDLLYNAVVMRGTNRALRCVNCLVDRHKHVYHELGFDVFRQ
jgi:hypothetical protein